MSTPWTDKELQKAIIVYNEMLNLEKKGIPFIKKDFNRKLKEQLPTRNNKSIEYRWQNISSVLFDQGKIFIKGYKPAKNVGANVRERILRIMRDLKS